MGPHRLWVPIGLRLWVPIGLGLWVPIGLGLWVFSILCVFFAQGLQFLGNKCIKTISTKCEESDLYRILKRLHIYSGNQYHQNTAILGTSIIRTQPFWGPVSSEQPFWGPVSSEHSLFGDQYHQNTAILGTSIIRTQPFWGPVSLEHSHFGNQYHHWLFLYCISNHNEQK